MLLLAAAGALVLGMVSWVALREAQRMPQTVAPTTAFAAPPVATRSRPGARRQPAAAPALPGPAPTPPWRTSVARDVAVADADTAEALEAAGALWHVMVRQSDRSR